MDIIKRRQPRQVRHNADPATDSPAPRQSVTEPFELAPKRRRKLWKKLLLLFGVLVLLGLGAVAGAYFYVKTAPLAGENGGRVNIMVLGVDKAAKLSDTTMIISLDTRIGQEPKLAMISIPRDLYVDIPEYGGAKINAAYSYGENSDYKGGGEALAEATIEQTFDLEIHHHAVLNFESFKDLVDAAGGVDIDVKEAIDDPFYPKPDYSGVINFSIPEGQQHMDGELALKYARSRYTTSDFDRAARQQQVILALKDKIINPETLWHPSRIGKVKDAIAKNVGSDLTVRQLAKLYLIFRQIEPQYVSRHVIDSSNYLIPGNFGSAAFVPRTGDFIELQNFIADIFEQTGNTLPEGQAD